MATADWQPGARVAAANSVLDRGWGKADQTHSVDANIQVTIRHILEHIDECPVIVDGEVVRLDDHTLPNDSDTK